MPPPSLEDVIDAESQAAIDSKNRQESIDQLDEEFIVLKSDINKSDIYFSVEKLKNGYLAIRSGLANIKNIGFELAKYIVTEREKNGEYK